MNPLTLASLTPAAATPGDATGAAPRRWHQRPLTWLIAGKAGALVVMAALSLGTGNSPVQAQPASPVAAAGSVADAQVLAAFATFLRASQGDEAAIESAAAQFAKLHEAAPGNVVLLAYAGSSHAMLARTTLLPWKKMKYADDGLAQIDKALALLTPAHEAPGYRQIPAVLDVKFTAASTFLALPGLFHRQERGQKLLADVSSSPLLKSTPAAFQAAVAAQVQKAKEN